MPRNHGSPKPTRSQAELFEGKKARDEALARVAENSGTWFERARKEASRPGLLVWMGIPRSFTAESLRSVLIARVGEPHHSNAWGALVSRLVKDGVIVPTGRMVPSTRKTSHAHRTPEYRAGGKP